MSATAKIEILSPKGVITNKDVIRGKVHLDLKSELTVKNIVVKLEGIARTEVPIPEESAENLKRVRKGKRAKDGKNVAFEVHKVLYRTTTVFPPREIAKASESSQFTLKPGSYEYPFSFTVPFKTECAYKSNGSTSELAQSMSSLSQRFLGIEKLSIGAHGLDVQRPASGHAESILPPSLSGLGEFASIKYFLKVTVNKASFFKLNTRSIEPFVFLPVDSPDLHDDNRQAFVRRELRIGVENVTPNAGGRSASNSNVSNSRGGGGFFKRLMSGSGSAIAGLGNIIPGRNISIVFEARYPVSGGFTPLQQLPLNLLLIFPQDPLANKLPNPLVVDEFASVLYASTTARAQSFEKTQKLRLDICNKTGLNLAVPLQAARQKARPGQHPQFEIPIGQELLKDVQIPDIVPPSFNVCNISRSYSLEIIAGFRCSQTLPTEYVSLVTEIRVTSGIEAPAPSPRPPTQTVHRRPVQSSSAAASLATDFPPPAEYPPEKAPGEYDDEVTTVAEPPPYEEVNGVVSSNVPSETKGSDPPRGRSRRKFGQADDYYQNMDAED